MNLFSIWKRQPATPPEVIQAACSVYGTSPERVPSIQAKRLKALSDNIWLVTLNNENSAVVAYSPDDEETTIAAPWYDNNPDL